MTNSNVGQVSGLSAKQVQATPQVSQFTNLIAYGPPASQYARSTQVAVLGAMTAGTTNVAPRVTQVAVLTAYSKTMPTVSRQSAWTFIMDGHRFYVLSLGKEGDWAYDTTTQEWCQLQSSGYDGLNFSNGVMWGVRVMGGDSLYPYLYELDPTQSFDEGWRSITRVVTGGIATRDRSSTGVANFSIVASVGDDSSVTMPISLAFSDDQGVSWSKEFSIALTDSSSQRLIWNALGSFSAPGRVFRVTDTAGPVRLDGADCVLTVGSGADSGIGDD